MPHSNSSMNEETQVISSSKPGMIILPDGSVPVKMGSGVVTGILGKGGMAIVYKIWNEQLGIKRAIKLLLPNSTKEHRERFDTEAKITAQLDHPNIIDIHSVGEWNGLPYIEMEMVDGISLEELIKKKGALPTEVCISIAIIICKAIDYTHHHKYIIKQKSYTGVLHRDLKPGNILISQEGIVRLTDFGIATSTDVGKSTSSGKIVGSMQYLAPEQLEEESNIDTRADVFAFGCIFYEMFTGVKTFPDRNVTKLVRKRLKNEFKPLPSFNLPIPSKLINLIHQCLQLNVNKRPSNIKDVLSELEKIHLDISSHTAEDIIVSYITGSNIEEEITVPKSHSLIPKIAVITLAVITLAVICLVVVSLLFTPLRLKLGSILKIKEVKETSTVQEKTESVEPEIIITPSEENIQEKYLQEEQVLSTSDTTTAKLSTIETVGKERKSILRKAKRKKSTGKKKTTRSRFVAIEKPIDWAELPDKARSLTGQLMEEYNTDDLLVVMKGEDKKKHYDNVLELYKSLSHSQSSSKEARLLKHRAYVGTNQINKSYFDNTHINDGEFYLSKAKFLYKNKQYQRSVWLLKIIKTTPTALVNKNTLHKDVLLYTARCNTGLFNIAPTPEKQKIAMQSWFDVKKEFRNNQNHPYFIEANREIRNINKNSPK